MSKAVFATHDIRVRVIAQDKYSSVLKIEDPAKTRAIEVCVIHIPGDNTHPAHLASSILMLYYKENVAGLRSKYGANNVRYFHA